MLLPPGPDASPSQGYLPPPPPGSSSPVAIYTPRWRETKWSKVPCLRKQRDGRGLNPGPPDPEFKVLTAWPHTPPHGERLSGALISSESLSAHLLKVGKCYEMSALSALSRIRVLSVDSTLPCLLTNNFYWCIEKKKLRARVKESVVFNGPSTNQGLTSEKSLVVTYTRVKARSGGLRWAWGPKANFKINNIVPSPQMSQFCFVNW